VNKSTAIGLINKLVAKGIALEDFKLFTMKNPGERNVSALFEDAGIKYILHVHYFSAGPTTTPVIKDIITIFETRAPVRVQNGPDFSAHWQKDRWIKDTPGILMEDRTKKDKAQQFLFKNNLAGPLDTLLRDFVASETRDTTFFDTDSNWAIMEQGWKSRMRSRKLMADLARKELGENPPTPHGPIKS
jgi:hypothetical protein